MAEGSRHGTAEGHNTIGKLIRIDRQNMISRGLPVLVTNHTSTQHKQHACLSLKSYDSLTNTIDISRTYLVVPLFLLITPGLHQAAKSIRWCIAEGYLIRRPWCTPVWGRNTQKPYLTTHRHAVADRGAWNWRASTEKLECNLSISLLLHTNQHQQTRQA
jgi:hypothetical protein